MKRYLASLAFVFLLLSAPVKAAYEPFLGEIMWVGYNFCPRGWAPADGALLAISSNQALFSLLGTQFGGDGRTTFAVPDLRGRTSVGAGQGPGLSRVDVGQRGGSESAYLNQTNLPSHNHALPAPVATAEPGNTADPVDSYIADGQRAAIYRKAADTTTTEPMATAGAVTLNNGGSQPFSVRDPYQAMTVCIATQGLFPSRN